MNGAIFGIGLAVGERLWRWRLTIVGMLISLVHTLIGIDLVLVFGVGVFEGANLVLVVDKETQFPQVGWKLGIGGKIVRQTTKHDDDMKMTLI